MKHLNIRVHGRVQGVFFRDSARRHAERLGIAGFVKNEPDGTVYIEAEGEEGELRKFLLWCNDGPPLAHVERVDVSEGEIRYFADFRVEHR